MSTLNIGTNVQISGTNQSITGILSAEGIVPAGSVIFVAKSTVPTGYLACNGASLNTTTYSTLYNAIGYTFGGSGSSFNIPDLRGEFLRGWDNGRGIDSGRAFGSAQEDALQDHTHSGNGLISLGGAQIINNAGGAGRNTQPTGLVSAAYRSATETRPRNIALLACIKY
jgi:phage-related tail fiber protein